MIRFLKGKKDEIFLHGIQKLLTVVEQETP